MSYLSIVSVPAVDGDQCVPSLQEQREERCTGTEAKATCCCGKGQQQNIFQPPRKRPNEKISSIHYVLNMFSSF